MRSELSHSVEECFSHLESSLERKTAWEAFLKLGFPTKKQDGYRDLPLMKLLGNHFGPVKTGPLSKEALGSWIYPECRASYLVFVDGKFDPLLSNTTGIPSAVILPLSKARKSYGAILSRRFKEKIEGERDPFVLLGEALEAGGIFIYFPPRFRTEHPLQIIHLATDHGSPALTNTAMHVCVGTRAEVDLISSHAGPDRPSLSNLSMELSIEEGGKLSHVNLLNVQDNAWHFNALRAFLKQDSELHAFAITRGSQTVRQDYKVILNGERAAAHLKGLSLVEQERQSHINVVVRHACENAMSRQHFKSILKDRSRSSFTGKIWIEKEAQKSQAYQLCNHLLLSEGAIATSYPNLEIFADDVKASHGATVSQLDATELFYLKTRGIPESISKTLLIQGFCAELIQSIPYPWLRKSIEQMLRGEGNAL